MVREGKVNRDISMYTQNVRGPGNLTPVEMDPETIETGMWAGEGLEEQEEAGREGLEVGGRERGNFDKYLEIATQLD